MPCSITLKRMWRRVRRVREFKVLALRNYKKEFGNWNKPTKSSFRNKKPLSYSKDRLTRTLSDM